MLLQASVVTGTDNMIDPNSSTNEFFCDFVELKECTDFPLYSGKTPTILSGHKKEQRKKKQKQKQKVMPPLPGEKRNAEKSPDTRYFFLMTYFFISAPWKHPPRGSIELWFFLVELRRNNWS